MANDNHDPTEAGHETCETPSSVYDESDSYYDSDDSDNVHIGWDGSLGEYILYRMYRGEFQADNSAHRDDDNNVQQNGGDAQTSDVVDSIRNQTEDRQPVKEKVCIRTRSSSGSW